MIVAVVTEFNFRGTNIDRKEDRPRTEKRTELNSNAQLALDSGEMTLGDALQAIGWLVEHTGDNNENSNFGINNAGKMEAP